MNKKSLFALVLIILVFLGGYIYFNKNNLPKYFNRVDVKESGIKYEMISLYSDQKDNKITYPKITNGVEDSIKQSINKDILSTVEDFCLGIPNDEGSITKLKELYENSSGEILSNEKASESYEFFRNYAISELGYFSLIESSVDLAEKDIFSVSISWSEYCGGAHENHGSLALNYNTKTGEKIELKDIVNENPAFQEKVFKFADSIPLFKEDPKCNFYDDYKSERINPNFSFTIGKDGLMIQNFGYPYVERYCEPDGSIIVPYSLIIDYIKKGSVIESLTK